MRCGLLTPAIIAELFWNACTIDKLKSKRTMSNAYLKILIKKLKNRWGSIGKKGDTINLNINLIKCPQDVIDYMILHELCHLKIKEHSHQFWNLLHKYMPNYQTKIDWLKVNGINLI
jgi:predicted metal-dependent hydrolase